MRYLCAAIVLALCPSAFADLVTNGDFESSSPTGSLAPFFQQVTGADSSTITAWTVASGGSVDLIGTLWVGADGGNSIDMDGTGPGTITQTLSTVVGQDYHLSFYTALNTGVTSGSRSIQIDAGSDIVGATATENFSSTRTSTSMEWAFHSIKFTASSTSTVLTFQSLDSSTDASGVALDDVSVLETPEPGAFLLFAAGLGGMGLWRRSQKKRARATRP